MTKRSCPWCGGVIKIKNCMATDSMCSDGAIHWEDRDCGYREVTTNDEWYDYKLGKFVSQEVRVLRYHKPRSPLPVHQQTEYLRKGIVIPDIPKGQITFEKVYP